MEGGIEAWSQNQKGDSPTLLYAGLSQGWGFGSSVLGGRNMDCWALRGVGLIQSLPPQLMLGGGSQLQKATTCHKEVNYGSNDCQRKSECALSSWH